MFETLRLKLGLPVPPSSINPNFGKRYSSKRSPLQAITTRAAQRFIRQGDDGKLCAFADLYEARECMPKELFDELDQEYSALSVVRQQLAQILAASYRIADEDIFSRAWRYKCDVNALHRRIQKAAKSCPDFPRHRRNSGSNVGSGTPSTPHTPDSPYSIVISPPSPSSHVTYFGSDSDESSPLLTPDESEFGEEVNEEAGAVDDKDSVATGLALKRWPSFMSDYGTPLKATADHEYSRFNPFNDSCEFLPHMQQINRPVEDAMAKGVPTSAIADDGHLLDCEPNRQEIPSEMTEIMEEDSGSDTSDALTEELLTAEIMVGSSAISTPASNVSRHHIVDDVSDRVEGVCYSNPVEFIDMYLHGYNIDPRDYWDLFSSLAQSTLQHIASTLEAQGIIAGMELIDSLAQRHRNVDFIRSRTPPHASDVPAGVQVGTVAHFTAELVSPTDPLLVSAKPTLVGAIGDPFLPLQSDVLMLHEIQEDPESSVIDLDMGLAGRLEGEDDADAASIIANPYGPSRSNTLGEDALGGAAPDGHLENQFTAMMNNLVSRPPASPLASPTHTSPKLSAPPSPAAWSVELAPELKQAKMEGPRLWNLRLSPGTSPTTPTAVQ